jgi:hypothetical protein
VSGSLLLPLHVGLAADHHWREQLLVIAAIAGLWLLAAGLAERRTERQNPSRALKGTGNVGGEAVSSGVCVAATINRLSERAVCRLPTEAL